MKKLLAFIMICITVLSVLPSCHSSGKSKEFKVPEDFDETKEYEITFWAKNDTNVAQTLIYEEAIKNFEALYPNIKVVLKLYTDYGRIYKDVITNIKTNTTPNVCITYPDHIATYLTGNNTVVDLNALMDDEEYGLGGSKLKFDSPKKSEIIPKFLGECAFGDKYYALPYMRSSEACYINKNMVEKLGYKVPDVLTWDFIWEVSDAAMKKDEEGNFLVNGQKIMIPFIYKSTDNMMIQMLKQKGAEYSDSTGKIGIFNEDTKEILYTIADHAEKKSFSTFKISSYPANFLNAGQCIFAVDSTAGATWMGTDAPLSDISEENLVKFKTEVRMIPQFDVNNPQMISQGPSVCIFNKSDSGEVMASWMFAQFLLTNEVQIAYSKTEGYVPVTSKAHNTPEYKDYLSRGGENNKEYYDVKIKATELILDNINNTFVTPVFNGSASLRNAAGQMIENVTKSINRKQTVNDEYIANLYEDMISLYHLDVSGNGTGSSLGGKKDLGKLPTESVILLSLLGIIWSIILIYVVYNKLKLKKTKKKF